MSRLTEWVARNRPVLLRQERAETLRAKAAGYDSAYSQAPWWFDRAHYLSEIDSRYVDLLLRMQAGDMIVNPFGNSGSTPTEQDRLRTVEWSRWWALYDPIVRGAINLYTDYGFGQDVTFTASDPKVQEVLEEFWHAPRNRRILGQRQIAQMSNTQLSDGEVFGAVWSVQGIPTLRLIPTEQITKFVTLPEDQSVILYYERTWRGSDGKSHVKYYPDFLAAPEELDKAPLPSDAIRAERENPERTVKTVPYLLNASQGRGWPLVVASQPWAKAYKEMCTDQAAVHRARASVVEEVEIEGGSRMVASLQQQLQSSINTTGSSGWETNPPPGAGSTRVQNSAVKTRRLGLDTGAADTASDSMILLGQAAVGMRLTTAMLGRTDSMQNKAIAEVAMRPTLRAWNRYQQGWRDWFEDVFGCVIQAAQEAGRLSENVDTAVQISFDSAIETDLAERVGAIQAFWTSGIVEPKLLTMLALKMPELALSQEVIEATMLRMYPEEAEESAPKDLPAVLSALRAIIASRGDSVAEGLIHAD